MQQRRRQQEAGRIGGPERIGRHLGAVGVTVEHREGADDADGDRERRLALERDDRAEHDHRGGDPEFDRRQLDPAMPIAPPAAIISTNVAGTSQSARPPSCQAKTPTVTIASTWSMPPSGCAKPCTKPCTWPRPLCAKAAVGTNARAAAIAARQRRMAVSCRRVGEDREKLHIKRVASRKPSALCPRRSEFGSGDRSPALGAVPMPSRGRCTTCARGREPTTQARPDRVSIRAGCLDRRGVGMGAHAPITSPFCFFSRVSPQGEIVVLNPGGSLWPRIGWSRQVASGFKGRKSRDSGCSSAGSAGRET